MSADELVADLRELATRLRSGVESALSLDQQLAAESIDELHVVDRLLGLKPDLRPKSVGPEARDSALSREDVRGIEGANAVLVGHPTRRRRA